LAIVVCPSGHKLRIPDGKRGKVTCPNCGAEWFHPETVELSDVEFRCSMSGARFNVVLSRRSPLHKFVVQKINKATQGASSHSEAEPLSTAPRPELKAAAPPLPLAAPRVGGWLARIVGRKSDVVSATLPTSVLKNQAAGATTPVATHSAEEYSWAGFSCPYCSASGFVSCSGGHLACDGTAKLRDGRRFHQCFCGHAGFITGTIKTFEDKRLSVEAEVGAEAPPNPTSQRPSGSATEIALAPPMKGGHPVKR
jgi:hypothetical protein